MFLRAFELLLSGSQLVGRGPKVGHGDLLSGPEAKQKTFYRIETFM